MKTHLLPFARSLRSNQTDAENLIWRHLRAGRLDGHKFKRQQPLGSYIVDFVCFEGLLVIELDGGQHADAIEKDAARSRWLESQDFTVLRFWNNEVMRNIEGVLMRVMEALPPSPQPSPIKGEGENRSTE